MRKATIIFLLALIVHSLSAQDTARISPYMNFQYFRNNGDSSYLKTTLTYVQNRVEKPLAGQTITFFSADGEKLKDVSTNSKGIAICDVQRENLKTGPDGMWQFTASFDGNDTVESSSADLTIRNASLAMECSEADSIRTIAVQVEKADKGNMVPAAGEVLTVYARRMFSLLPVGEITLDDNGSGLVEFPGDLPGDIDGNVTLIARFEDHPEFGNLERQEIKQWGVPFIATDHTSRRALWTKTAPKWMIYTLSILLAGVWGHYLFTIISLVRIKLSSGKSNVQEMKTKDIFIKQ
ncbi:MAG TPA: hypothetical protein VK207_00405 [Bacteroidales bacterium]|nr:hypothetical protein [Bacteroidales bacterium]